MGAYLLRRLVIGFFLIVGATFITFLLTRIIPSNPETLYVGRFATPEQIARARIELGLDKPWYIQYWRYLSGLFQGNWGISLRTHRPVTKELLERLPASLELIVVGMTLGFASGVLIGLICAARPNSFLDNIARVVAVSGVALPQFWFAMILQLVFGKVLGLLPLVGRIDLRIAMLNPVPQVTGFLMIDSILAKDFSALKSALTHLVLPALSVAMYPMAMSTRLIRAKVLEILGEDFIRTARAFGIPEHRVFARHALQNALGPIVTMGALSFVFTLIGTFLVESIFGWPGIGSYTAESILSNDYPVVMSIVTVVSLATIVLNLLADLILAWLDPRIRLG